MRQITHGNLPYVETLYSAYLKDPSSVDNAWQTYFAQYTTETPSELAATDFAITSIVMNDGGQARSDAAPRFSGSSTLQEQLNEMIRAYRSLGHKAASFDPLGLHHESEVALDPEFYGFTPERMEQLFPNAGPAWKGPLALREILKRLRETYCGPIGVEFMHIEDEDARQWLERGMEESLNRIELTPEQHVRILKRLIDAVSFEEFIRKKFLGAKSFSLEGAESLIPLLDLAIEKAAGDGVREIVLAMAHRGRLNVLANVMGKRPWEILREFDDPPSSDQGGGGDVKYHLGYSNDYRTASGKQVHLSLCFNPSHLEFVNPVALGRMRAKQDRANDRSRESGLVLLIHGDAAFAGEGITQEILNMSQLPAYSVGGTLHVVLNNQIGFTTSPAEGRSTRYATDVAKMLDIPVFHVNGDDPEAVAQTVQVAMDFRRQFKRDAVIDMYCYRRLGHNEGDEPKFTQPKLYRAIEAHRPVAETYLNRLLELKLISADEAAELAVKRRAYLEQELTVARTSDSVPRSQSFGGIWADYAGGLELPEQVSTSVPKEQLVELIEAQRRLPKGFQPHPKIQRAIEIRREMAQGKRPLDWSTGEALAFATLAMAGVRVRLSGQDSARGTFSHRHAILRDFSDGHPYVPLQNLRKHQAAVEIYNSPLSEAGVLGFEYGYSLDCPDGLVLWEAQFGDFVNAAQVIVDQFITSAEEKWRRLSGLVLLLPHGFEGMGPEHSSARMERFLQLCAKDNIQVVYPTTPAQYFHCLRRQVLRKWRKPLIVMTPKSLLRHANSVSPIEQFSAGQFESVLADNTVEKRAADRVILCSGKVYFDLTQKRAELKRSDAIVRMEQLYPTPKAALRGVLEGYAEGTPVVWVQEEPRNMGAACFWHLQLGSRLFGKYPLSVVARPLSASPATGSMRSHRQEQAQLLAAAFDEAPTPTHEELPLGAFEARTVNGDRG